jgi:hypothetical protein
MTVMASDESEDEDPTGPIDYHEPDDPNVEVDPVFQEDYEFPGTVKITVGQTNFWSVHWNKLSPFSRSSVPCITLRAHKEMLYFASPFFKAALSGG